MIEGLKPYAEYKESGQRWLGRVPAHWDVRRTKLILREVDSRSTTGKEQLLRVSQYTGVTQRKAADGSDAPDTRAASLIGYKRVAMDDLVINIMLTPILRRESPDGRPADTVTLAEIIRNC